MLQLAGSRLARNCDLSSRVIRQLRQDLHVLQPAFSHLGQIALKNGAPATV
jgi:DNA-binding transcriptional regulator YiaG